tara:strand:- start:210 stop:818 length:609 start_codon:yes stop_codon:yes gene_type:complete
MGYYYNFWNIYLLFLLFILLIIILFPNYTKKDLVPPLSDANYNIDENSLGVFSLTNSQNIGFSNLVFEDGVASGTSAIDFGTSGPDTATISYIPYYSESHKPLMGYFDLNIGTSLENTLAFRVVDENITHGNTLGAYNYGWTTLKTADTTTQNSVPVYNVKVPFNIPGYTNINHKLTVQGSITSDSSRGLELSSAYLYYYPT